MKKIVTLMMCLFSVMSFAQKDYSEFVGDYKGSYSKLFGFRTVEFNISLKENRHMEFDHPEYGFCSSENSTGTANYQMMINFSTDPIVRSGNDVVDRFNTAVFCDDGEHYPIIVELRDGDDLDGVVSGGVSLLGNRMQTIFLEDVELVRE